MQVTREAQPFTVDRLPRQFRPGRLPFLGQVREPHHTEPCQAAHDLGTAELRPGNVVSPSAATSGT
ncbi:hypothetical protein ACF09Y_08070 [Streptomyces massasporeus]|uniref:hypothetical protein n=1 Tax=Streptomyces massasporeus TaxID=67324 RepID=UPI0036FD1915